MLIHVKALWLLFFFRQCTNAGANGLVNKETRTLSHFSESALSESSKNVIFSEKILQIRPTAPATTTEPRPAEPRASSATGNNSNYVRTARAPTSRAGDSNRADPNSFFSDLFQANDGGNEATNKTVTNFTSEGKIQLNAIFNDAQITMEKELITDESYHEDPQKFVIDDCSEIIFKSRRPVGGDIRDRDMENINKEKYPETNRVDLSNVTIIDNIKGHNYQDNAFSQRSIDYQRSTLINKLINSGVTRSIIERDISNEKLIRKQELKKKDLIETKSETTRTFIYNPTIADSSDDVVVNVYNLEKKEVNRSTVKEVTEGTIFASYTESVWQETEKEKPKIRFSELPQRETYLIPSLKLEDGPFPFQFVSGFFTLIYPYNVPDGLLRDIFWGNFSFPFSVIKSVTLEWRFLALGLVFVCCGLFLPAYLICRALLALCSHRRGAEEEGILPDDDSELGCGGRLRLAQLLVIMMVCGVLVAGMALSNESAAAAMSASGRALRCACADLSTWMAAAARDIRHAFVLPADLVLAHYKDDLKNVEQLLGEPIQKAIASESGMELVLDSVTDITTESSDISRKISSLRDLCVKGSQVAVATSDRLRDLSRQLDSATKLCSGRDTTLCETINSKSLEINVKFDLVLHEQQLLQLRALGAENLTRAATAARQQLRMLPAAIASQTLVAREEISRNMETRRDSVYSSSRILADVVRHLTALLQTGSRKTEAVLTRFRDYDAMRWTAMLGCVVASSFVVTLTMSGLACGCSNTGVHTRRTLRVSICWMSLVSLALWAIVIFVFLVAGHAEVYICRALWDGPEYPALSSLLDRPGVREVNSEPGGMMDELFRDMDNVTMDLQIRDIIRECEQDHPAYTVFRLDHLLDINRETAFFEWSELERGLDKLSAAVDVGALREMSVGLSHTLQEMRRVSQVNMAHYRLKYNGPLVGKDLISLAEQLENVATRLSDLTTSSRIESLASRTRRLLVTNISPLEQLRTELVFKLTELELQLVPFHRQLNTSLSHLRTMQYYVDNQGGIIAQKKVSVYTGRLTSHTAGWRTHALSTVTTRAARCRALYTIFSAGRALTCSHYVASLHGFWLCALCCALLWCYAVPCCLQLCKHFDSRTGNVVLLANLNNSQHELSTICDSSNWNTPGPPPPQNGNW